jgi:hypothetical protein
VPGALENRVEVEPGGLCLQAELAQESNQPSTASIEQALPRRNSSRPQQLAHFILVHLPADAAQHPGD